MNTSSIATLDYEAWRLNIRAATFSNYHYEMGIALLRENSQEAAIHAFQRALEAHPGMAEAAVRLTEQLKSCGKRNEAEAVLESWRQGGSVSQALLKAAEGQVAFENGQHESGLALAEEAYRDHADERIGRRLAEMYATRGFSFAEVDFRRAIPLLDRAAALAPDDVSILAALAFRHMAVCNLDEAEALYRRVVAVAESDVHYVRYSWTLIAAGKYADAEATLKMALCRYPHDPQIQSLWGLLLHASGRVDEAVAHFRQLAATTSATPQQMGYLALALLETGALEEAAKLHADAVAADPSSPHTLIPSAAYHVLRGDEDSACRDLGAARTISPARVAIWIRLHPRAFPHLERCLKAI
ncbi:MAG TPA: tetratricopeptide repeat protein [Azospirillaceae bacterium]|nr:tetratricopeptide repeat protein [Azospirillaceae bacterium]